MFTRRISQTYDLGVFTVAFGTAWACTHGDLLPRNCHSLIVVYWLSRRRITGGRRCLSLIPSPSMFNLSRWLFRLSVGMSGSNPAMSVERRCRFAPVAGPVAGGRCAMSHQAQYGHLWFPSPWSRRAMSRQLINASPVKGLVRKQLAPAFSARSRALSVENAVMKMNGTRYPSAAK